EFYLFGAIAAKKYRLECIDELLTRSTGLPAQWVHALFRAAQSFIGDLHLADAQDLRHHIGVNVIRHGHVVQDCTATALLGSTTNFAAGRGDVINWHIPRI